MKTITLSGTSLSITHAFTTTVTKVISPEKDSKIVLGNMPNVQLSLGENSATELGITKDTNVTLKPVEGSTDGSFTLSVGEATKPSSRKSSAPATRGNSPMPGFNVSNSLM